LGTSLSCGDLPKLYGASVAISWGPPIKLEILPSFVVPQWRFLGSLQLSCGDCSKLCAGSVTALKCPIVIGSSILVGGLEEITVSLRGVWGALCLHTAPTEISIHKSVNFGIYLHLCMPRLFLYPISFTYAIYFVIAIVLEVLYILLSHSCLSCLA
jgi:hypothetical protein